MDETSVKATSGGGVADTEGAAVADDDEAGADADTEALSCRRRLDARANRGNGATAKKAWKRILIVYRFVLRRFKKEGMDREGGSRGLNDRLAWSTCYPNDK